MQDLQTVRRLALLIVLAASCLPAFCNAGEEQSFLKGRIFDQQNNPVSKAKIIIEDDRNLEKYSGLSDGEGYFKVKYDACDSLSFCVVPPPKSSLCRAEFRHVNGETAKHFIVRLHRGFKVSGRITYKGSGLKDLDIDFYGSEKDSVTDNVHGGGHTTTHTNGEFALLLTPGKKTIQITNNVYSNVPASFKQSYVITRDCRLAEIAIPDRKEL